MDKFNNLGAIPYEKFKLFELPSVTRVSKFATAASEYDYVNQPPIDDSPAVMLGGLFDSLVTGKDADAYQVVDVETGPTSKAFKKAAEEIIASGKKPITQDMMDKAKAMANSFMTHPFVKNIYANEVFGKITFQCCFVGKTHKGIADIFDEGNGIVYEIKTSSNPAKFKWQAFDMGYDMQLAAYKRAFSAKEAYWLVIDSSPPHEVFPFRMKESTYEAAITKFDIALEQYMKINTQNPKRSEVKEL